MGAHQEPHQLKHARTKSILRPCTVLPRHSRLQTNTREREFGFAWCKVWRATGMRRSEQ